MSSDSQNAKPVFGSFTYGNVFAPSALAIARQYVSPEGHGRNKTSRSKTAAASRTFRQYGEPSYSNTSIVLAGLGPSADASLSFFPATRNMEYPGAPSSRTIEGNQPLISAPVPPRSTNGIALETTLPRLPCATVNFRGSGGTNPTGAEMEAGSCTARHRNAVRRDFAVHRPRTCAESALEAAMEAAMLLGRVLRCDTRDAVVAYTRRAFVHVIRDNVAKWQFFSWTRRALGLRTPHS
jgi:hypothetical protein